MPHPNSVTLETTPPVEAARDREAVGRTPIASAREEERATRARRVPRPLLAAQAVAEAVRIAWWTAVHLLRYVFVGRGADRTVRLAVSVERLSAAHGSAVHQGGAGARNSVAQVHRAVLPGGDVVAVKVVKRGVRERLEASSWLLGKVLATVHAVAAKA